MDLEVDVPNGEPFYVTFITRVPADVASSSPAGRESAPDILSKTKDFDLRSNLKTSHNGISLTQIETHTHTHRQSECKCMFEKFCECRDSLCLPL